LPGEFEEEYLAVMLLKIASLSSGGGTPLFNDTHNDG
jgi:hypothetical protein